MLLHTVLDKQKAEISKAYCKKVEQFENLLVQTKIARYQPSCTHRLI